MPLKLLSIRRNDAQQPDEIRVGRALSHEEEAFYLGASEHLWEYVRSRDLVVLVEDNEHEVKQAISRLATRVRDVTHGSLDHWAEMRSVDRGIVNYLASSRLYLDHRDRQLKRRYGASSPQWKAFRQQQEFLFDREPLYRFVYKYRNYVQHCGLPVSSVPVRHEIVAMPEGPRREDTVSVGCDRDCLLSEYSEWGKAREFLVQQPAHFEILPILHRFTQFLWGIEQETIRSEVPVLWRLARRVAYLLAEACDDTHSAEVAEVQYDEQRTRINGFNLKRAPLPVLEKLKLIQRTDDGRSWRIRHEILAIDHPPVVT